jgi:prepilin-type N-terminal cleavage/methylation domain-containing protein
MKFNFQRRKSGMTLIEVVVALGVIAFAIPVIFAMIGATGNKRRDIEADTRSAWLAREVQREVFSTWARPVRSSLFGAELDFPEFGTPENPEILLYDGEGNFLKKGSSSDLLAPCQLPRAVYVVTVYATKIEPNSAKKLSHLWLRVLHPARAQAQKRSQYAYHWLSTQHEMP